MRGEKTIEFDFEFEYSDSGDFAKTNKIFLQAPGLHNFGVHNEMSSVVKKAGLMLSLHFSKFANMEDMKEKAEEEDRIDDDGQMSILDTMAMGLETDKYVEFMDHLKKILSHNTNLAWIDSGNGKHKVSDAVWMDIEHEGGMVAVQQIMDGFMDFFTVEMQSKKQKSENGNGSSQILSLDTVAR